MSGFDTMDEFLHGQREKAEAERLEQKRRHQIADQQRLDDATIAAETPSIFDKLLIELVASAQAYNQQNTESQITVQQPQPHIWIGRNVLDHREQFLEVHYDAGKGIGYSMNGQPRQSLEIIRQGTTTGIKLGRETVGVGQMNRVAFYLLRALIGIRS